MPPIAVASGGRWRALGGGEGLAGLSSSHYYLAGWLARPSPAPRAAPAVAATGTVGVLPVATSRRGQRQVMLRASSPHLTDTMTGPKPRRFINPSSWAGPPKQLPINHKTGPKPHASHLLLVVLFSSVEILALLFPSRHDSIPRRATWMRLPRSTTSWSSAPVSPSSSSSPAEGTATKGALCSPAAVPCLCSTFADAVSLSLSRFDRVHSLWVCDERLRRPRWPRPLSSLG